MNKGDQVKDKLRKMSLSDPSVTYPVNRTTQTTRRGLLSSITGLSVLSLGMASIFRPSLSRAFGEREYVGITFLDHGEGSRLRPRAAEQLMWEVSKRTSIQVREAPKWVKPEDQALFDSPLIVWLGRGSAPAFSELAKERLNLYLRGGGLLFIDDISAQGDERFHQSVQQRVQEIWPETRLHPVEPEHTIYKSFFLLDQPHGRLIRSTQLQHISFDDLSPILYSRNDSFGAYGRSPAGEWLLPTSLGGRTQRERAFRFGVNLVMYSTCLNYKRDQVHALSILRRRRFQAR